MMNKLSNTDMERVSGGILSIAGERKVGADFVGPDTPQQDDGSMQQHAA